MIYYEAFISYRRNGGSELAEFLKNKLEEQAILTFYDHDELHFGDFRRQLILNNLSSKNLILLLTNNVYHEPNALTQNSLGRCENDGDWVKREIKTAMLTHKRIIPIVEKGFSFEGLPNTRMYKKLKRIVEKHGIVYDREQDMEFIAHELIERLRRKWTGELIAESVAVIESHRRRVMTETAKDQKHAGFDEAYEDHLDLYRDNVRIATREKLGFIIIGILAIVASLLLAASMSSPYQSIDDDFVMLLIVGMPFGFYYYKYEPMITDEENGRKLKPIELSVKGVFRLIGNLLLAALKSLPLIVPIAVTSAATNGTSNEALGTALCCGYCAFMFAAMILTPYLRIALYFISSILDLIIAYSSPYFCVIFKRERYNKNTVRVIAKVTKIIGIIFAITVAATMFYVTLLGGDKIA